MTVNVELLEQVMQHIEDHPAQHDQSFWVDACGTAACFAGWACLLSGWQVGPQWWSDEASMVSPDTLIEKPAADAALDLLGLEYDEANTLFCPNNTRPMLRLMVKDLANGDTLRSGAYYAVEAGGVAE